MIGPMPPWIGDRQSYWSEWRPAAVPQGIERSFQPGGWVPATLHGWLRKASSGEWYADVTSVEWGVQHVQLPADLVRPLNAEERPAQPGG